MNQASEKSNKGTKIWLWIFIGISILLGVFTYIQRIEVGRQKALAERTMERSVRYEKEAALARQEAALAQQEAARREALAEQQRALAEQALMDCKNQRK